MAEETIVEENAEVNQEQQTDATQTDGAQAEAGQPDAGQTEGAQPDAAQPEAGQTEGAQPDAAQTDGAQAEAAGAEAEQADKPQGETAEADSKTQAQSIEFAEAVDTGTGGSSGSIEILLDMGVPITVVIGKTDIPVRRLLQLGPGSVLRLDKSIDAPVDLYLKDTLFATGNVVVVDSRFAVRIDGILGLGKSEGRGSAGQSGGA